MYLCFALVAVVLTAVLACVVFGQLILAELLELVSHRLLQAHRQRAAEALETSDCSVKTDLVHPDRPDRTTDNHYDLLYCRFWLFPANQTAAVQQHRSICGHVAWWAAGWQPEPIRSSQWSEYLTSVECKVPPRLEQTDHIIYDIHDYVYHSLAVLTLMTHHFKLVIWEYLMCVHQGWKIKQTPKWKTPPKLQFPQWALQPGSRSNSLSLKKLNY